jgi:hypothetical protein
MLGAVLAVVVLGILLFSIGRYFYRLAKKDDAMPLYWILFAVIGFLLVPMTFKIICWAAMLTDGIYPNYSDGERIGYVTKLSHKGAIWKTYEGQLQIGQGEQVAVQQPFEFSVSSRSVLDKLQKAMEDGKKVKLKYREWLIMPYRLGSSGYEIVEVSELP